MNSTKTQIPKVKWAQRKDKLFITIDAVNVKDPKIDIVDNQTLKFTGKGEENVNFSFELEFYEPVNKEESKYTLESRNIFLNIKKQTKGPYWPRLTKKTDKLNYLSPDWQLYVDEDEEDEDSKAPKLGNEQGFIKINKYYSFRRRFPWFCRYGRHGRYARNGWIPWYGRNGHGRYG